MNHIDIPNEWNWATSPEKNMLTYARNQHIPEYCGACWAFAVSGSLSDRIKILRKGAWPDIIISPQVLLSCDLENSGCSGGSPLRALKYIHENQITDDSCSPYRARGHLNGYQCSNTARCKDCPGNGDNCFVPDEYNVYGIEEYGQVIGEEAMKQEIFQRGPITCGISVPDSLLHGYTGGIYEDTTGDTNIDHEVSVVGYGQENGVEYWLVRNSWGTWWGEGGFFRVVRGKNNLMIESDCVFAVPKDTWTENVKHRTTQEEKDDPNNETDNSQGGDTPEFLKLLHQNSEFLKNHSFKEENHKCRRSDPRLSPGERIFTKTPWQLDLDSTHLPEQFDWRNVEGVNYASINKNQHIPKYCGSCWAHGTTSSLADRFQILNGPNAIPISLSTQVVVNCQPGGGSCFGGNPLDVYEFAYTHGIPDDTCQQYIAHNSEQPLCSAMQVCEDCLSPSPKEDEDGRIRCKPITNYKNYFVKEYGRVSGAHNMKMEIFKRGPIDCGIESTNQFHAYTGGVYREHKDSWDINHAIAVVGWGKENGEEYWIGRNSWGAYWGEGGYFRMKMHEDNNAIEQDCNWAVPSYENVSTMNVDRINHSIESLIELY